MQPRPMESFRSFYSRLSLQADKFLFVHEDCSNCKDEWIRGRLIQVVPDQEIQMQLASANKDIIDDVLSELDGNQKVSTGFDPFHTLHLIALLCYLPALKRPALGHAIRVLQ